VIPPGNDPTPGLHPAQNRALRELYASARQLSRHWSALSERLDRPEELSAGIEAGEQLLDELGDFTASYDLHGLPAAQGMGVSLAGMRNVVADRALERNQALRLALLDLQHLTTLLAYLAALGEAQGDAQMVEFCGRWERKLKRLEGRVRRAAIGTAEQPNRAIDPVDSGPVGRAGQRAAWAMGTVGEWLDRRAAERRGRG
jgi:hypothetical protein